jgi:hypothetical protein
MREAMFDRGALALASAAPDLPHALYACPLCLDAFDRSATAPGGELTIEHVPPESLGGRPMCLTCRRCNNTAGSRLDSHMERHRTFVDFIAGAATRPIAATFTVADRQQRGLVQGRSDGLLLTGVAARNRPGADVAMIERLDDLVSGAAEKWSLGVAFDERWESRRVNVGWLRTTYLAAFAALGYHYVAQPGLALVREQVARPDDDVIPLTVEPTRADADPIARSILLVEQPIDLRSVAVQIGRTTVLLPPIESTDVDFFRDARAYGLQRGHTELHGKLVPWPTRAGFLLDL